MELSAVNEQFSDLVRAGVFAPVARHLMHRPDAEDRLQEGTAMAWQMFARRAVEKDEVLPTPYLVNKCRWSACDLNRRLVGADGASCRNQDVMSPAAYRDGKVEVLRLDGLDDDNAEEDRGLGFGYAEAAAGSPERKMNSALDLDAWLGELTHRDRALMERKAAGFSTKQTASDLGLPYHVAWHREKQLGQELASRAGVRVGRGK